MQVNCKKVTGKVIKIIANDLKLSPTQVGRYQKVNNNLIPELKNALEKELESKYADKLNSIKDEVKKQTNEKTKLKDEISNDTKNFLSSYSPIDLKT
ncbi:hypothetical protein SV13_10845, partial [Clostridium perfringens]